MRSRKQVRVVDATIAVLVQACLLADCLLSWSFCCGGPTAAFSHWLQMVGVKMLIWRPPGRMMGLMEIVLWQWMQLVGHVVGEVLCSRGIVFNLHDDGNT